MLRDAFYVSGCDGYERVRYVRDAAETITIGTRFGFVYHRVSLLISSNAATRRCKAINSAQKAFQPQASSHGAPYSLFIRQNSFIFCPQPYLNPM
jgi:hypothetical protein